MKVIFKLLFVSFIGFSCNIKQENNNKKKPAVIHDTIYIKNNNTSDWQNGFGLTHDSKVDSIWNKPVDYYLQNDNCSGLAIDFYYGYFRPSDNGATQELLELAMTDNEKLRPFYRWCLNKTLVVSDGALGELVGVPARQYAEKFPDEFFNFLDIDTTKEKYKMWTDAIVYSGFFDYNDYDDYGLNRKILEKRMTQNLKLKNSNNINRVKKFAKDCTTLPVASKT